MFVNLTFDMIFSISPGLNRASEEGPTARADLTAVVTVLARPLAANLEKKTRVMRKYTSTATRVMRNVRCTVLPHRSGDHSVAGWIFSPSPSLGRPHSPSLHWRGPLGSREDPWRASMRRRRRLLKTSSMLNI